MILTDSHAHLEMVAARSGSAFLRELLEAYAEADGEARAAGRPGPLLLDPGVEATDLPRRLALTGTWPFLRRAAGIWPSREALAGPEEAMAALESAIAASAREPGFRLAAIGECGLDFHHMKAPRAAQEGLFARQTALARRLGLPLIVHSREAAAETLALLRAEAAGLPVLIHCFGYGPEEAKAFLEAGCWLSFAGNLSYRDAEPLREALLLAPRDRLLLETDAPYLNPEPRRGRPSSPLDLERTYRLAAELRGEDLEDLAEAVSLNARRLFG